VRILFLSHYFPPEVNAPASRTFEHCREWVLAGHEVTVVTCAPNHPRGVVYQGYRNRLWQTEQRDGIRVIRLWTFVTANEGFFRRTLGYVSFMVACMFATPFLPKADVVLSTSPQFFNGLAGYPVSRLKRAAWVLEIRDLWPESIVVLGSLTSPLLIRILERLELFAYHKADVIVPVTDSFKKYMMAKGIAGGKIRVIKNGADVSLFQRQSANNQVRSELGFDEKLVFAYLGTLGMAHRLETVLEAAELLRQQPHIIFLLIGDGADRDRLLKLRETRGLSNVVIREQQPKNSMPMLWDLLFASIVHLKKSPLFRTVIPSKIFESMAMERPILLGVEGEAAEIVTAARAGVTFEPENAQQLAAAVLELSADPAAARRMGASGRQYVVEHFDRRRLAAEYEGILLCAARAKRDFSVSH
jgi:glycosyltransferase involved in cell wall biosynthesis